MTKRIILFFTLTIFYLFSYSQTKSNSFNLPLKQKLDSVLVDDQKYRLLIDLIQSNIKKSIEQKNIEIEYINEQIKKQDQINLEIVSPIIDKYGWLSSDVIGENANSALFLVIQHSNQETQEKYLPIMREAVKNGNAEASALALLEDRVALGQGKKQIYGSQLTMNVKTGMNVLSPIEDEINVNKRRKAVGLEPIEEYVKYFGITYKFSQSNIQAPEDTFISRHSLTLSIGIIVTFYIVILFLVFQFCNIKWFYLMLFYLMFFTIAAFLDFTNEHSLIKAYQGNFLIFMFIPIVFHSIVIFLINYAFNRIFSIKNIFIETASILISTSLYSFVINEIMQKIFIPESGIVFFKNIIESAFYSSIFLIITFVLYLLAKRKRKNEVLV
ncbi:MAG: hypothetical protein KAZ71_01970 [Bacteroidia bacterium]|nr:hypothetical protein [Bacteroidia bacterium]